ncbi:Virginiamycin B lyase [Archangium sp.]|uniref:Vgb family protein n=1 Tax=Archangium sp. TaxID=1872627 RepID=UPI00389A108D
MRQPRKLLALAVALTSLTALAGGSSGSLTSYGLPNPSLQPNDITVAPNGNVWFTELADTWGRIGRLDTQGKLTEFATPEYPDQLTVGSDGNIYFTMPAQPSTIGRITPAGVITVFTPPNDGGYHSFPADITSGPDGNLWFTMGDKIFKMTTSGEFTSYTVTSSIYPDNMGITAGPDGALWFAEHNGNKIGRIDVNGNITEFGPVDQPHTIGAGPDGNVWFAMPASSTIGRITPTGTITLFPLANSPQPWNPVAGPDGNIWFTEYYGTRQLAKISPDGVVTQVQTVLGASGLARGVGNTLWITQPTEHKISKFTLAP